jgi:glycosyltransferase involved in cell wall biosynthesis
LAGAFSAETAGIETMPRVSVILPVYNRAAVVPRCIRSVLAQSFTDFELIAVDDASTDNSVAVVETFTDPRLRLLRHGENAGPSAARNTAIAAARGEIIALIDSDDEWLPEKLAHQLAFLDQRAADLCACEYFIVDGAGVQQWHLPDVPSWREDLHFRCELGNGTTLMLRRNVIGEVGPMDETLRLYEDWDWVLRMVADHSLLVLHEPLARIHVGAPRPTELFARSASIFLSKHAREFGRLGRSHHRRVRAAHFQYVAENAFANRRFLVGCRYLVGSYLNNPLQNPLRLGAVALAPVDALCGTSLIARAAQWQRARFARR